MSTTPTPSITASVTPTISPTNSNCPTSTATPTPTETPTNTPTQTQTQTATPPNTPTQTNTNTPTQTATMTNTPTQTASPTPSTTPCTIDCCFSAVTNPMWTGTNFITELKAFNDGSLFVGNAQGPGTFNGVTTGFNMRIPACGTPISDIQVYTPNCFSFVTGIVDNYLYQPQSDGKLVFVGREGGVIWRYSSYTAYDTSFNEMAISAATPNSSNINGIYVNNTDQIYVIGRFDGVRNCSGLTTNQTFNTNIFRLNSNGSIDTTYSGISLGVPSTTTLEPRITTEKDPNGNVLILGHSAFTANTIWRGVMRFQNDGTPDPTFNNSLFSAVTLTQLQGGYCQSDGKYMVFGSFTNLAGTGRSYIVRLNSDGTLDTSFNYSTSANTVNDLEQDSYGNYHVARLLGQYQKLSSNGTLIGALSVGDARSILVNGCSVFVGGTSSTNFGGYTAPILKFDTNQNLNMCILPTPTPSVTPTFTATPSRTPSITPTSTVTPSNTATLTVTPTSTNANCDCWDVLIGVGNVRLWNCLGVYVEAYNDTPDLQACLDRSRNNYAEGGITYLNPSVNCNCPEPTPTPSVTTTNTPTTTPSNTPTLTPTPSNPPPPELCECWEIENTDVIDISIKYYNCQGLHECVIVDATSSRQLCISANTQNLIFVSSGTTCAGGAEPSYTWAPLGSNCTGDTECFGLSYYYYNATQYLNCVQNSAPGAFTLRVPTTMSGMWFCGDDGFQYQFDSNQFPPYSYTVTATAEAISCGLLPC